MKDAWRFFRAGLPAFMDEMERITKKLALAVYYTSLVMTGLVTFFGGLAAFYTLLYPRTALPIPWAIKIATAYFLVAGSIHLVRHIIRLGQDLGGKTIRPIPGAGIELRGGGPHRWRP